MQFAFSAFVIKDLGSEEKKLNDAKMLTDKPTIGVETPERKMIILFHIRCFYLNDFVCEKSQISLSISD